METNEICLVWMMSINDCVYQIRFSEMRGRKKKMMSKNNCLCWKLLQPTAEHNNNNECFSKNISSLVIIMSGFTL